MQQKSKIHNSSLKKESFWAIENIEDWPKIDYMKLRIYENDNNKIPNFHLIMTSMKIELEISILDFKILNVYVDRNSNNFLNTNDYYSWNTFRKQANILKDFLPKIGSDGVSKNNNINGLQSLVVGWDTMNNAELNPITIPKKMAKNLSKI